MTMVASEERILAQPGDVIGIHYPDGTNGGIVPYETYGGTPVCCGLSTGDFSRTHGDGKQDNQLTVGTVLNVVVSTAKRLPALKPILVGKICYNSIQWILWLFPLASANTTPT